jgi:hypothetical protein
LYKGHTNTAKILVTVSTAEDLCDAGKLGVNALDVIKDKAPELLSLGKNKIEEYYYYIT